MQGVGWYPKIISPHMKVSIESVCYIFFAGESMIYVQHATTKGQWIKVLVITDICFGGGPICIYYLTSDTWSVVVLKAALTVFIALEGAWVWLPWSDRIDDNNQGQCAWLHSPGARARHRLHIAFVLQRRWAYTLTSPRCRRSCI